MCDVENFKRGPCAAFFMQFVAETYSHSLRFQ
jgi:hypothetical protein